MRNQEGIEVSSYSVWWNVLDYDIPASKFVKALEEIYWYGVPGFELQNVVTYEDRIAIYLTSPNEYLVRDWMYVTADSLEVQASKLFLAMYEARPNAAGVKTLTNLFF